MVCSRENCLYTKYEKMEQIFVSPFIKDSKTAPQSSVHVAHAWS